MRDSKNDVPHNLNSFDVLSKKYTKSVSKGFLLWLKEFLIKRKKDVFIKKKNQKFSKKFLVFLDFFCNSVLFEA